MLYIEISLEFIFSFLEWNAVSPFEQRIAQQKSVFIAARGLRGPYVTTPVNDVGMELTTTSAARD